jgi:hypothetical protein
VALLDMCEYRCMLHGRRGVQDDEIWLVSKYDHSGRSQTHEDDPHPLLQGVSLISPACCPCGSVDRATVGC